MRSLPLPRALSCSTARSERTVPASSRPCCFPSPVVDRLDIIADYQISNTYLQPMLRTMVEDGNEIFDEKKNPHLKSDPDTMDKFCTYLEEECGGVRAYLKSIGVTDEELDAIVRKLTD